MKPKIIVHCLIKNEENFIWYALNSILPYVDEIMVWDTGSTDRTVKIIKSIKSPKISFQQQHSVTPNSFPKLRQKMLKKTPPNYTWLMILDGDEIWPENSIKKATAFARNHFRYESIVVRTNNLVGDIYHRLPESAGHYQLAGKTGHLALRFINLKKIPGLHVSLPYGQEGYFDQSNQPIQNRDLQKIKFLNLSYHHATHLTRSSQDNQTMKRIFKRKYEIGETVKKEELPHIFFSSHPSNIPDVTSKASLNFRLTAAIQTPFRRLKRQLLKSKSGY